MLEAAQARISARFDRLLTILDDDGTPDGRSAEAGTGERSHTQERAA